MLASVGNEISTADASTIVTNVSLLSRKKSKTTGKADQGTRQGQIRDRSGTAWDRSGHREPAHEERASGVGQGVLLRGERAITVQLAKRLLSEEVAIKEIMIKATLPEDGLYPPLDYLGLAPRILIGHIA